MNIRIVERSAEHTLVTDLARFRKNQRSQNVLHCRFSRVALQLKAQGVTKLLTEHLTDMQACIYFCADGDLLITWPGQAKETMDSIIQSFTRRLLKQFEGSDNDDLFKYYESRAHENSLGEVCQDKISSLEAIQEKNRLAANTQCTEKKPIPADLIFTQDHIARFKEVQPKRKMRNEPEILIVEDQLFTRKLLKHAFDKDHIVHVAPNASEALLLYSLFAPDITFLDIELPDGNGHSLAEQFTEIDKDAFIIMVTSNHYASDVNRAKENGVRGYVVKPFTIEKILHSLDGYKAFKKWRAQNVG
ncbi:MAG: response regulator [Sneathiellales bacterium]|nr:response regulator [Sneathiellales bacterium]